MTQRLLQPERVYDQVLQVYACSNILMVMLTTIVQLHSVCTGKGNAGSN